MIKAVPATPALLDRFFEHRERPGKTVRAVVLADDDEPMLVVGVVTGESRLVGFIDAKPEIWENKRAIVRRIRAWKKMIDGHKAPIFAMADPEVEAAERFLVHCGLERLQGQVFVKWT